MCTQRYSVQRERIYQIVFESKEHPTAEMVFQQLKPELPKLSLGTVYRNLHLMVEEGRLQELVGSIGRFDANVKPHTHFICNICGAVRDLPITYDATLDRKVEQTGCAVEGHWLTFYGICSDCVQAQTKEAPEYQC